MPRVNGAELDDPACRNAALELAREGIGGFILFGGDIESTPRRLAELQTAAPVPLLISSDVERGLGQQLAGGTRFPSQRAIASAIDRRSKKDEALLLRMLDAVRIETRAAGIHAVFSPVMDVNNNPDNPIICTRAFGDEPEIVEWFGRRYIRRLQLPAKDGSLDLLACAKHYPGHGDTDQDSHSVLPVIRADRARLNRVELPPFREAVKAGVGMVMVAHLSVPALDPDKPVTFSKKTVTALLREGMEFNGLIVSDALDMGAIANTSSPAEIAVGALHAGMDVLLHPRDARETIDAVVRAVEEGRITRERIRESVTRIMTAKTRLGLFATPLNPPLARGEGKGGAPRKIDYAKHRELARELGGKAVKVVSSGKKALPFDAAKGIAGFVLDDDSGKDIGAVFLTELMQRAASFSGATLTPASVFSPEHAKAALDAAGAVAIAIFSKVSASKGSSGISPVLKAAADELVRMARSGGKRSAVISFDSPYILDQFRDADVRIAGYDRMAEIQTAAAEMLMDARKGK